MTTEISRREGSAGATFDPQILEQVVKAGNLKGLSWQQQWSYYLEQCQAFGLDPAARPFDFITERDRGGNISSVTLYLNAGGYAQIRDRRSVNITEVRTERIGDVYVVYVTAVLPNGRTDIDVGVVPLQGYEGKALSASQLARAMKVAVTQGKRRVTQSLCGLKMLDESELGDVPQFQPDQARLNTMAGNSGMQIREADPVQSIAHIGTAESSPAAQGPQQQQQHSSPPPDRPALADELERACKQLANARKKGETWKAVMAGLGKTLGLSGSASMIDYSEEEWVSITKAARTQTEILSGQGGIEPGQAPAEEATF